MPFVRRVFLIVFDPHSSQIAKARLEIRASPLRPRRNFCEVLSRLAFHTRTMIAISRQESVGQPPSTGVVQLTSWTCCTLGNSTFPHGRQTALNRVGWLGLVGWLEHKPRLALWVSSGPQAR